MSAPKWTPAEFALIHANPDLLGRDLVPIFHAAGFERSEGAIDTKRGELGLSLSATDVIERNRQKVRSGGDWGWPSMRGKPEARDAAFVRRVLAEALRLGLVRQPERRAA
jgi:hypothetical protein